MSKFESAGGRYWDARYGAERFPFGPMPSRSALRAIEIFREHGARTVVVAGCGSGRNLAAFARTGFETTGFDVSPTAVAAAREELERSGLRATLVVRDLLAGEPFGPFDALFSHCVIQLFAADEREAAARGLVSLVRPGGVAVISTFAREDFAYGDGTPIEPHTFRNAKGRTAHFFDRDEFAALLRPHASQVAIEPIEEPNADVPHRMHLAIVHK
jgi:SAM-dependent methyltransferase